MDANKAKLKLIDLLLKTENKSLLSDLLVLLKEDNAFLNEERRDRVNDLEESYVSTGVTLEEKRKILRQALEEGEKSEMVENFNLESFLQELHREHL